MIETARTLLQGPYVWTARDLAAERDWVVALSPAVLDEIDERLQALKRRGTRLDAIGADDFPLASFAAERQRIDTMLAHGRGFALVRGLPVARYPREDVERIFCGLGAAFGVSVSQSYRGDRLGRVMDIGEPGRYYTVGGALEMHMDPVDAVALLCLRKAAAGGESRIASAMAVHNAIAAERPDLLEVLREGFHYASRPADRVAGDHPVSPARVPVFDRIGDMPACFYLPIAARAAEAQGCPLTDREREALALVNAVASRDDLCLEMDLEPGDIQILNNRLILHGRNDYTDPPDPAAKREMLRLWLMTPGWPPRPETQNFHGVQDRARGGIPARRSP